MKKGILLSAFAFMGLLLAGIYACQKETSTDVLAPNGHQNTNVTERTLTMGIGDGAGLFVCGLSLVPDSQAQCKLCSGDGATGTTLATNRETVVLAGPFVTIRNSGNTTITIQYDFGCSIGQTINVPPGTTTYQVVTGAGGCLFLQVC